jgi:hypothetical protein
MAAADATAGATGTAAKENDLRAKSPLLLEDEVPSSLAARATRSVALDDGESGADEDALVEPSPLPLFRLLEEEEEESSSSLSSRFKCCNVAYRRRKISSFAKPL